MCFAATVTALFLSCDRRYAVVRPMTPALVHTVCVSGGLSNLGVLVYVRDLPDDYDVVCGHVCLVICS